MKPAAIGLRSHSGWAALVSLAGTADAPAVISRRRIVTADPAIPGSKQPYHYVEEMALGEAAAMVAHCRESALALAAAALTEERKRLATEGFDASVCAVLQGRTRDLPALERILSSHPLLHTAEGIFYRLVLLEAAEAIGMRTLAVAERGIEDSIPITRLTELGRGLGSPWTVDQKYAAAAAWLALKQ